MHRLIIDFLLDVLVGVAVELVIRLLDSVQVIPLFIGRGLGV